MALLGNGTIPAVDACRLRLAKETGFQIMELVKKQLTPRSILTEGSLHQRLAVDMASWRFHQSILHCRDRPRSWHQTRT